MKKIIIFIALMSLLLVCFAGNFTYKIRPDDTFYLGSLTSPRATISSTGVTVPGTLTVIGSTTMSNFLFSYEILSVAVSGDVIAPDKMISLVTTTNDSAVNLSNATYAGQYKRVILATAGGVLTLTPVNFVGYATIIFSNQLASADFLYDGSNWNLISAVNIYTN